MEGAQIITQRARAESHGEADRRSCSQHPKWRLRTLKWNVYVGRVVEQIIDVQKPQVLEKIVKVPKVTQQVEDTQYRQSAVNKLRTHMSSQP